MTDTEILTQLCSNMRSYWITGVPLPPARLKQWAVWVDERRKEQPECRRAPDHFYMPIDEAAQKDVLRHLVSSRGQFAADVMNTGFEEWATSTDMGIHRTVTAEQIENLKPQRFWRCRHHPEAIHNWGQGSDHACPHGCDKSELRWHDHGVNAPRGTVLYSTTTLGQPPKASHEQYKVPVQGECDMNYATVTDECKRPTA